MPPNIPPKLPFAVLSVLGLGFLLGQGQPAAQTDTLKLGGLGEMRGYFPGFKSGIYQELGRRLGIRFVLIDAPSKRLYRDMALERLDGLAYRSRHIEAFPGLDKLLRVPIALGSTDEGAYTLDSTAPCLHSWGDLKHVAGKFTTVAGYMSSQKYLDSLDLRDRAVLVDSVGQAMRLLVAGQVRYVVDVTLFVEIWLNHWRDDRAVLYAGTMSRDPYYLYLSPRLADVAGKAETAIAEMQEDAPLWKELSLDSPRLTALRCRENR